MSEALELLGATPSTNTADAGAEDWIVTTKGTEAITVEIRDAQAAWNVKIVRCPERWSEQHQSAQRQPRRLQAIAKICKGVSVAITAVCA